MNTEAAHKVDILIEALPYLRKFFGKVVVVKYGGSAVEQAELNHSILEDISFMNYVGIHPVVVHGAGLLITQKMRDAGLDVKFINGIRVTDKPALNIINIALSEINRNIVKELKFLNNEAKGFVGTNGELIFAEKMSTVDELGFVGSITNIDKNLIFSLLRAKIIPVIAPLGVGDNDEVYNLNADTVAAEIAAAMDAEKLALLTNVCGIMQESENPETLLSTVSVSQLKEMIASHIVRSGMIPKANACIYAVENGVSKTHIINAQMSHALLSEVYTDKGVGTEIIKNAS